MQRILIAILACLLLSEYTTGGNESISGNEPAWNGEVQVYGALRAMFHEGQTGTMVTLDSMLPNPDLYAVGALTGLSGEITIIGGKTYLSYPESADSTRTETSCRSTAGAALLVTAEVPVWHSITIENSISFEELDQAIAELAASAGMNLDQRFPFLLLGDFENLQWHVIDGSRLVAGGTSHQDHLAASTRVSLDRTPATLVGFYSAGDQGVFTHMGSRTHIHCLLEEPPATGHVDHVNIPAGITVMFPVPNTGR